jgi:hypothetical protein
MQHKSLHHEKARWIIFSVRNYLERLQSQQALLQNCQRQKEAEIL